MKKRIIAAVSAALLIAAISAPGALAGGKVFQAPVTTDGGKVFGIRW